MAYIKRETALKIVDNYTKSVKEEENKIICEAIRDIVAIITPPADVVEVVRCRDCIYSSGKTNSYYCAWHGVYFGIGPDGFCSCGVKEK